MRKKKILDKRNRRLDDVFVYTGIVDKDISEEEFRKKNKTFPNNGYYISCESFFQNTPPDGKFVTFNPECSSFINKRYKGAQFLRKGGVTEWLYVIENFKLNGFHYILNGRIEYPLVEKMLDHNGYTEMIYSYTYNNREETMVCNLYYNKSRNVILKIETNTFLTVMCKLYCPNGILPSNLIFKPKPSFLSKDWLHNGLDVRKMVKPSGIKMNKNQLNYIEKQVVEIIKGL